MAFIGERARLEGNISGFKSKFWNINLNIFLKAKELQRALWTDPPKVRIIPGIPRYLNVDKRKYFISSESEKLMQKEEED